MSNTPTDNNTDPVTNYLKMRTNHSHHDDEINLVDLWLSLVTHKKLLFITTALIIFLAVLYVNTLATPLGIYTYKTDIVIGTLSKKEPNGMVVPRSIQNTDTVIAILNNSVIPMVLSQQHLAQSTNKFNVSASVPKKTRYVLLTSTGTDEKKDAIIKVHQQIISFLDESHQSLIQNNIAFLNEDLNQLQSVLSKLPDLSKGDATDNAAITSQMIAIENDIRQTKQQISQFKNTYSAMGTVQTVSPSKKNKKLILSGSVVIGLFIGIFAALFASFLAKVKEQSIP